MLWYLTSQLDVKVKGYILCCCFHFRFLARICNDMTAWSEFTCLCNINCIAQKDSFIKLDIFLHLLQFIKRYCTCIIGKVFCIESKAYISIFNKRLDYFVGVGFS